MRTPQNKNNFYSFSML